LRGSPHLAQTGQMPRKAKTHQLQLLPIELAKTLQPDASFELAAQARGFRLIAGVDEAGRGPLAGPVVSAAVILDLADLPLGLNDSKQLNARQREAAFDEILAKALAVSVASIAAPRIDDINILAATMEAMATALQRLSIKPDYALIDGNRLPDALACPAKAIVKGDARSVSIAAASIIAKVIRDRMMVAAGTAFPLYGFESHKGYGSAQTHQKAIMSHGGVLRLHRFSFAPLKH
jgi:ribonuclease HII